LRPMNEDTNPAQFSAIRSSYLYPGELSSSPTKYNAPSTLSTSIVGKSAASRPLETQQPLSAAGRDAINNTSTPGNDTRGNSTQTCHQPSKIKFCPFLPSLYGCINSIHAPKKNMHDYNQSDIVNENSVYNQHEPNELLITPPSMVSMDGLTGAHHRRMSSIDGAMENYATGMSLTTKTIRSSLLELRCLHAWSDESSRRQGTRFTSHVLGISRGIAGSSAVSTCLTFRPNTDSHPADYSLMHGGELKVQVATGLSSGSLCVHTGNLNLDSVCTSHKLSLPEPTSLGISYYTTRYAKHSTCVAWRPKDTRFVAIGLQSQRGKSRGEEFCCFVWDLEHQSGGTGGGNVSTSSGGEKRESMIKSPSSRFARNVGVASVNWLDNGALLAVGTAVRNMHLYDLRIRGSNSPPVSAAAHSAEVSGIISDPTRPSIFATFSQFSMNDPVKLWDIRKMDRCLVEIKTGEGVSDVEFSTYSPGLLCVSVGDNIRFYDITGASAGQQNLMTRPVLIRSINTNTDDGVQCMAFPTNLPGTPSGRNENELYPRRVLVTSRSGVVSNIPTDMFAPLAISSRDGRIAHGSGGPTLWMSAAISGSSVLEYSCSTSETDISGIMMRRARCLQAYSTDAAANLQMLSLEGDAAKNENVSSYSRQKLLAAWNWVLKIETLSNEQRAEAVTSQTYTEDLQWPAKGLCDAGVQKLLRMDMSEEQALIAGPGYRARSDREGRQNPTELKDVERNDSTLGSRRYESQLRKLALIACGWVGKSGISDVLEASEARGHFERSAAMAVFHGELGAAVASLQRGASQLELEAVESSAALPSAFISSYKESLQLVAMCIAGYSSNLGQQGGSVWRNACVDLLQRPELNPCDGVYQRNHIPYIRAALTFLCNIGSDEGEEFTHILEDDKISLCDRVGFACHYLSREKLRAFLEDCVSQCVLTGDLEGLLITGLDKIGFTLLSAHVDRYGDVQTAALISSRVILPSSWRKEHALCSEWLDCYRDLLNTFQMWKSRALFDIGRAELLRRLKLASLEASMAASTQKIYSSSSKQTMKPSNRAVNGNSHLIPGQETEGAQSEEILKLPNIPPQLYARCNFCNTSLPLSKLVSTDLIKSAVVPNFLMVFFFRFRAKIFFECFLPHCLFL